jgi:hypothetical protein
VDVAYTSVEPKFIRDRYILVAAIDIVIKEGVWNIYVTESACCQQPTPPTPRRKRTYEVERI